MANAKEKRGLMKIDVNTVIDVLLRSERDKHDAQLDECLSFCHANLDLVLNHHGNALLEVSDSTIKKLAFLFHHHEVEAIRDKRDRIKSKLYRHLTERLLLSTPEPVLGCPDSGSTLFRCNVCNQQLTTNMATKVKCSPGHYTLDQYGTMVPCHIPDSNWHAEMYIRNLVSNHITWKRIYWIVWGQIHYLTCERCKETVPCYQISQCHYHPEPALYSYDRDSNVLQPVGRFPCCMEMACRFDPWEVLSKGCRRRDHLINPKDPIQQQMYHDLLHHREMICSASETVEFCCHEATRTSSNPQGLSNNDKTQSNLGNRKGDHMDVLTTQHSGRHPETNNYDEEESSSFSKVNDNDEYLSDGGSSETDTETCSNSSEKLTIGAGCEEQSHAKEIFGPITRWRTDQNSRWDVSRSRRHNHDVLRECEQRRFQEIVGQLLQMRTTLVSFGDDYEDSEYRQSLTNDKRANDYQPTLHLRSGGPPSGQNQGRHRQVSQQQQPNGYLCGSYARVEAQWKSEHAPAVLVQVPFPRRASVIAIARFKRTKKGSA